MVCHKPFKKNDLVLTDKMFNQIQHEDCFIYNVEFIKDVGTYEEIVEMNPQYKNTFIVSENPEANQMVVDVLNKFYH